MTELRPALLVVEDSPLTQMLIEDAVTGAGVPLLGPAGSVADARALTVGPAPRAALLDVRVADGMTFDLARDLAGRGTRVLFATGYEPGEALPADLTHLTVLRNPFRLDELTRVVRDAMREGPAEAGAPS